MLMATSAWAEEGEIFDTQPNTKNSIYLACEAGKKDAWSYKPGPHTIKDLLENKIDLTLDKKKKKMIKRGFKQKNNIYDKKRLLEGKISVPLEYIDKMFDFVAIKILDKSYEDKKTICTSSNTSLTYFGFAAPVDSFYGSCNAYEEKEGGNGKRFYWWEKREGLSQYRKTIDREALVFHAWRGTSFVGGGSTSKSERYKCYISNLDEINKLEANYKNYLKPFEEEWERLLSEFILKEKVINDTNKI